MVTVKWIEKVFLPKTAITAIYLFTFYAEYNYIYILFNCNSIASLHASLQSLYTGTADLILATLSQVSRAVH